MIERLTLSILQSPALWRHRILLHRTPRQVMYISGIIYLPHQCACRVCRLLTGEYVKIVIGRMSPGVAFRTDGRPKYDEIPL